MKPNKKVISQKEVVVPVVSTTKKLPIFTLVLGVLVLLQAIALVTLNVNLATPSYEKDVGLTCEILTPYANKTVNNLFTDVLINTTWTKYNLDLLSEVKSQLFNGTPNLRQCTLVTKTGSTDKSFTLRTGSGDLLLSTNLSKEVQRAIITKLTTDKMISDLENRLHPKPVEFTEEQKEALSKIEFKYNEKTGQIDVGTKEVKQTQTGTVKK